jgi:hypothetical protein
MSALRGCRRQGFKQSELKFHDVIGTDNPDLSEFREHGGKMIIYMGWLIC